MQGCFNIWKPTGSTTVIKWKIEGRSQNSGGVGWGDHFLPHKFIKTSFSFECWETSTKQLLNSGGGHQGPRKAVHSLQNEVGQNIKDKKRDKRIRNGDQSLGGSQRRRSFQTAGNLPTSGSVGSLGVSEGDITGRKKEKKKKNPQNTRLTATPSGEVAQTLTSTSREQGLTREARAASLVLRVRRYQVPGLNALRAIWGSLHQIATQTMG